MTLLKLGAYCIYAALIVVSTSKALKAVWPDNVHLKVVHYICVEQAGDEPDCRAMDEVEVNMLAGGE